MIDLSFITKEWLGRHLKDDVEEPPYIGDVNDHSLFDRLQRFRHATMADLEPHLRRVRECVLPKIKAQQQRKEIGADEVKKRIVD